MTKIRMAQYGTRHGHAEGKYLAMLKNPDVEVMGVYEPDAERRQELHQSDSAFRDAVWYTHPEEMLDDDSILAIASEGWNSQSLDHTEAIVQAGKHVWYDKPAGDNWEQWQRIVAQADEDGLLIQMGYMFRYHHGFRQIAEWAKAGTLGEIYSIRAHMSTNLTAAQRTVISEHNGGIFYDLGGHMLDQVVWLMGRPTQVTAFLRNDTGIVPAFQDNTLGVFEFKKGLAFVDISAMEPRPMARRYEVYGSRGSAIIVDPFEPARTLRLCLEESGAGYDKGVHIIQLPAQSRQDMYEEELKAFVATLRGEQPPDRPLAHELLVQETLLRATGGV
ncbi:MAG: Gfo/Idh/MocA family oxidoreductase [Caldilineaceae bacterium]|nr:Gfo/Idh/MocA family oxidoreductase [Caldilineaceae bacterium]